MKGYQVSFNENALHKAVNALNNEADVQCNKLMKLDNSIYNAETLEKLIKTVHEIHNATSSHEKLFAGEHDHSLLRILYTDALGIQHYATNSLLFLRVIQDKYIALYRELCTYISTIEVLAKGYLPNTLITPKKLQEILSEVKNSLLITNSDYTLVLDRLHLYYDMQLITFGIDSDMNLVIQFPSIHTAIYAKTFNFISAGNSSSPCFRSKYEGPILHTFENQKALYSFKFRDIYFTKTRRIKIMQKDRL